jgi:hypothetical protein
MVVRAVAAGRLSFAAPSFGSDQPVVPWIKKCRQRTDSSLVSCSILTTRWSIPQEVAAS